jgi:hypothetical protein
MSRMEKLSRPPWRHWTAERIIELLREDAARRGRAPLASQWGRATPERPSSKTVQTRFGSWRRALFVADLPPTPPTRRWSDAEIIASIRRWAALNGGPPTSREWAKAAPGRPSSNTVAEHFGGWSAAIKAAGFKPHRQGGVPRTHCARGHELAGENLGVDARGHRYCKACRRAYDRAWKRRRRGVKRSGPPPPRQGYKAGLYAARREAGLCGRCGRMMADDGYATCEHCRAEMRAHWRERYAAARGVAALHAG